MKFLKRQFSELFNHSLLIGMVSIIAPSVIKVEPLKYNLTNDSEAISSDWKNVGSYIQNAYDTLRQ